MAIVFGLLVIFGSSCIAQERAKEVNYPQVCYEPWGCFSMAPPFINTGHLPQSPQGLGVRFSLLTRGSGRRLLDLSWPAERYRGVFNVTMDTRVILHGYLDSGDRPWVQDMSFKLLEKAEQNVLIVDWARGAASINYFQVAANTRLVARMLTAMLRKFMQIGAPASSFHLIGVSLGAHIAGYVGSSIPGLGRITGLDPAGPAFESTAAPVRLDPSDAVFVDVIHTNALPIVEMGLGFEKPCGTVDFYPNGGRYQPGCPNSIFSRILGLLQGTQWIKIMSCNHLRALHVFTDSITTPCPLQATPSYFPAVMHSNSRHVTQPCDGCVTMGYDVNLNASGVFYVRTSGQAPFCAV
ncbi:inactive pancreatic lipase-related protein 1-like [Littorina saxatilis]|uniref:Lipase domain-containing protein n=1 Tax=Littorina saxatilis TaxID=31220 RepID=A0AAN9G9G8_9CAEN